MLAEEVFYVQLFADFHLKFLEGYLPACAPGRQVCLQHRQE